MTNTQVWFKGFVAALIGGAVNSLSVILVDPVVFNFSTGLGKLASAASPESMQISIVPQKRCVRLLIQISKFLVLTEHLRSAHFMQRVALRLPRLVPTMTK